MRDFSKTLRHYFRLLLSNQVKFDVRTHDESETYTAELCSRLRQITVEFSYCWCFTVHESWFLLRRAVKISAVAAADNFGWLGGALSVFRRRRRRMIPAGVGGAIRRLRGLPYANTYVQYGILKLTPSTCSDISRVPDKRRVSDTGRGSRQTSTKSDNFRHKDGKLSKIIWGALIFHLI